MAEDRAREADRAGDVSGNVIVGQLAEVTDDTIMLSSGTVIALPRGMSAADVPVGALVKILTTERDGRAVAERIDRLHG